MAICAIDDSLIGNVYGNFYVEPTGSVLAVSVYDQIRADLLDRFPSSPNLFAQCRYRVFTRVVSFTDGIVQVYGGTPTRYKFGQLTFENSGHSILGEEYITYVQQQHRIKYVLATELEGTNNISYTPCDEISTQKILVGITAGFNFVADYQLADGFILDPAPGVNIEAFVLYAGFYNAEISPPPGFAITYLNF